MARNYDSKQKTLFEAWHKKVPVKLKNQSSSASGASTSRSYDHRKKRPTYSATEAARMCQVVDLTNDLDDDDLLEAVVELETSMVEDKSKSAVEFIPGFDNDMGTMWIYPTNYPVRDYQYAIVKTALFKNTLVSLPTGLGKTFIAAVVMYNFYRWYPQGKVVFMAPTKPLVSQQIEACYKIMGIPYEDQAEITGMTTAVHKREALWRSKRVFFLTPQVINNDLARGVCPASEIKCVVIDEAHKAQGKHAYCQVIHQLGSCSKMFRVLALSATPGTDVNSVQQVINNLLISHIEIRSEDSLDIQGYSHHRKVQKMVCKLDDTMITMRNNYLQVIEVFTNSLVSRKVLYQRDTANYSKYGILLAREEFRKNPPSGLSKFESGAVERDFATCISLFHGLELLLQHGMRSFFIFIKAMMEGEKGNLRAKTMLNANETFRDMFATLLDMFGNSPNATVAFTQPDSSRAAVPSQLPGGYVYSHPKVRKLEEVVVGHFESFVKQNPSDETRVMVFCQYRDTVQEITELLQKHRPAVRPMQFVGHSNASGKMARFTQKDQLKVVSKFRSGGYNTLISTCVGEEGLDIGDVDLIVCFDAHKSPIRLVQRMGRTGRKRAGRIVMLVTEGKEERDYNSSVSNRKSIQKAITGTSSRSLYFYQNNPRMVPRGLNPEPLKMQMTVKAREDIASKPKALAKKKANKMDISLMIKKEQSKNSVFLSFEKVEEWDAKFKLSAYDKIRVKKFPSVGRMVCLGDKPSTGNEELCHAEWNLWQTRLQDTSLVGHSTTAKNFVQIMSLCDDLKQCESVPWNENDHKITEDCADLLPFAEKQKNSQHTVNRTQTSLDKFVITAPCDIDDTLAEVPSILLDDHVPSKKLVSDTVLTKSRGEPFVKLKKIPEKIVRKPVSPPKYDPLLDFINDASDLSDNESQKSETGKKESGKNESEKNDSSDTELNYDSPQELEWNLGSPATPPQCPPLPSPPMPDFFQDSDDDTQISKASEDVDFSQGFDLNFEDEEEDLFSDILNESSAKSYGSKKSEKEGEISSAATAMESEVEKMAVEKSDVRKEETVGKALESTFVKNMRNRENDENRRNEENDENLPEFENDENQPNLENDKNHANVVFDENRSNEQNDKNCGTVQIEENHRSEENAKNHPTVQNDKIHPSFENVKNRQNGSLENVKNQPKVENDDNHDFVRNNNRVQSNRIAPDSAKSKMVDTPARASHFESNFWAISQNTTTDEAESQDLCAQPEFEASADIFSPNFDLGFDISPSPDSSVIGPSPDSVKKREKEKQISPGLITVSQKVENRAFFAELGKTPKKGVKTLIAQVRPQMQACKISPSKCPIVLGRVLNTEVKSPVLIARQKRLSQNMEVLIQNRDTDSLRNPSSTDDSPIFLPKNRKRILATPESDLSSQVSVAERDFGVKNARKRLSGDSDFVEPISKAKKHSTPKSVYFNDDFSDDDFECTSAKISKTTKHQSKRSSSKRLVDNFLDDEAEVDNDGVPVSTDEDESSESAEMEEMKDFVNDAAVLTQHIGNGAAVDESAMYLQKNADFFGEEGQFGNNNGKFKLAFDLGCDIDVFSQEEPEDVSDYEQDSFVCDEVVKCESANSSEVSVLENSDVATTTGKVTRRQVELNRLKKFHKDATPAKRENKAGKKPNARKRIVCFDESTDSVDTSSQTPRKDQEPSTWTCPACTLQNNASSLICDVCDCERPDVVLTDTWTCVACTYLNRGRSGVCHMCGKETENDLVKTGAGFEAGKDSGSSIVADLKNLNRSTGSDVKQSLPYLTQFHREISVKTPQNLKRGQSGTPLGNTDVEERLNKVLRKRLDFRNLRENLGNSNRDKISVQSHTKCTPGSLTKSASPPQEVINSSVLSPAAKSDIVPGSVILVDSKELSSCQPIITSLRNKHKANVTVASLPHCDYIIGIGTAVTRHTFSDISQVSSKQKLSPRYQKLNIHYDRVFAIIEQDSVKKGEMAKRAFCSNHFMSVTCWLAQCNIRVLYSENQDETAEILQMLAAREKRIKKGIDSEAAAKATDSKSRLLLKLFLCIPRVSFVSALYMCLNFKSFKEATSSSVEKLIQKAHMSTCAAAEVYTFCRRKFDLQMTPAK